MDLTTRELTAQDHQLILDLWAETGIPFKPKGRDSHDAIAREMNRPHCRFLGMFSDDQLLVVGIANWDGRRGWINHVAVDPAYRGIGLAGQIIEKLEMFLREQGATVLCALIEEENEPCMTCFEKAGFVCEPMIKYFAKRP